MNIMGLLRVAPPAGRSLNRLVLLIILICLGGVVAAGASGSSGEDINLGDLNVVVWSATVPGPAKKPVIIFSHGFHGNARQSTFLMEALAAHGYLVFAPHHRDAVSRQGGASWLDRPEEPFRNPEAWNDRTYRDRAEDIRRLIMALTTDQRFRDRVDLTRLGLIGHSLGGYTVLGLGGAWPSWRLHGVKAVLALSPYCQPFLVHQTLRGLAVPVMYQGGTFDFGITPALAKVRGAFDQSSAPKYFVEFTGAGHLAWTDLRASAHQAIIAYSLAFLDHYVRGLPAAPVLTKALPGVAGWRYEGDLGSGGAATGQGPERQSWRPLLRQRLGFPEPSQERQ